MDYPFIGITPRSILTRAIIPIKVPSMGQTDRGKQTNKQNKQKKEQKNQLLIRNNSTKKKKSEYKHTVNAIL